MGCESTHSWTVPYTLDHIPQESGDLMWPIKTDDDWIPQGQKRTLTQSEIMAIPPITMSESV